MFIKLSFRLMKLIKLVEKGISQEYEERGYTRHMDKRDIPGIWTKGISQEYG